MAGADLHVHSTVSDGRFPPREILRRAYGAGLEAMALTDHDTLGGNRAAQQEADRLGLLFIPGCEISVQDGEVEIHLLAYFVTERAVRLEALLRLQQQARRERMLAMVDRLRRQGISIAPRDVEREADGAASVGRMHVAYALKRTGAVTTLQEAFSRYIGDGGPAFVRKETAMAEEIVAAVWADGAVPVLAHPGLLPISDLESYFRDWDLGGIEADHPAHTAMMRAYLGEWALRRRLVATGGSDWHGDDNPRDYLGCRRVDLRVVDELRGGRRGA